MPTSFSCIRETAAVSIIACNNLFGLDLLWFLDLLLKIIGEQVPELRVGFHKASNVSKVFDPFALSAL